MRYYFFLNKFSNIKLCAWFYFTLQFSGVLGEHYVWIYFLLISEVLEIYILKEGFLWLNTKQKPGFFQYLHYTEFVKVRWKSFLTILMPSEWKRCANSKEMIKRQVKFHKEGCSIQQGKKKNFAFVRNKNLWYKRQDYENVISVATKKKNKMEL